MKYKTEKQLVLELIEQIKFKHTASDLARKLGISQSFLSEVLNEKKRLGPTIPEKMGYEIVYIKSLQRS